MENKKRNIIAIAVIIVVAGGMFYAGMAYEKHKLAAAGLLRGTNPFSGMPGQPGMLVRPGMPQRQVNPSQLPQPNQPTVQSAQPQPANK